MVSFISTSTQLRGRHSLALAAAVEQAAGGGFGLGLAQSVGLSFAAAFRHGFGEIGEQHREPEPEGDLEGEAGEGRTGNDIAGRQDGGHRGAYFHHEHDGVLHHEARIQLDERVLERAPDDRRIEQGTRPRALFGHQRDGICSGRWCHGGCHRY
jgi:uncharacterized low-complexity protein